MIVITDIMEVTSLFSSFITQIQNIQSVWKIHLLAQNMVNLYFQKKYLISAASISCSMTWKNVKVSKLSYLSTCKQSHLLSHIITYYNLGWMKKRVSYQKVYGDSFLFWIWVRLQFWASFLVWQFWLNGYCV